MNNPVPYNLDTVAGHTLLEVLACPVCHRRLTVGTSDNRLHCETCRASFGFTATGQPDMRLTVPDIPAPPAGKVNASKTAKLKSLTRRAKRRLQLGLCQLGNNVECCFCGWTGARFMPSGRMQKGNRLCPRCGSIERYRALSVYLQHYGGLLERPIKILDVATKPCFADYCRSLANVEYISSDLVTEGAMVFSDLTRMGMASASFDIITCLHVMEHIPDDIAAYKEIKRLLKPDGFALVMVPLRGDETFEDPTARPEDYERLFGQCDHIRYYGMDIVKRLESCGLKVATIDLFSVFPEALWHRFALYGDDRFLFRLSH